MVFMGCGAGSLVRLTVAPIATGTRTSLEKRSSSEAPLRSASGYTCRRGGTAWPKASLNHGDRGLSNRNCGVNALGFSLGLERKL